MRKITLWAPPKTEVFNGSRINRLSIIQFPVHQSGKKGENSFNGLFHQVFGPRRPSFGAGQGKAFTFFAYEYYELPQSSRREDAKSAEGSEFSVNFAYASRTLR
jgi:hypothetical protein